MLHYQFHCQVELWQGSKPSDFRRWAFNAWRIMAPITASTRRQHALDIWQAALTAVRPEPLVRQAMSEFQADVAQAKRIVVVGAGKAGSAMARGLENALSNSLHLVEGLVNVPADSVSPLRKIRLHAGRPAGSNHPAPEGVSGAERMLEVLGNAGPEDLAICLLSGGGSALLPAPDEGISLSDKQETTRLLHACGASINEMNAV